MVLMARILVLAPLAHLHFRIVLTNPIWNHSSKIDQDTLPELQFVIHYLLSNVTQILNYPFTLQHVFCLLSHHIIHTLR